MPILTPNQWWALTALKQCDVPWNAQGRSNRMLLRALEKKGLATYRVSHPIGFEITDAGRQALGATSQEGDE